MERKENSEIEFCDFSKKDPVIEVVLKEKGEAIIYALLDENKRIIYIGRTECLEKSIANHLDDKCFRYFKYFVVDDDIGYRVVYKLLEKYQPVFNHLPAPAP